MTVIALALLTLWCTVLSLIDLRTRRLPDLLTLPGALAILGYAMATGRFAAAAAGALLLFMPYLLVHLAAPCAFGAGDVKLALGLGAAAACGGAPAWAWAAVAAPALTGAAGVVAVVAHARRARASPAELSLPHGPSMCLATVVALLTTP
ncbi:A24 family peptidase [Nocardia transvalensis]|uniref:prepilin peptidase n=1 Tax=Nocardia transvalensis TaxID=37333 RepID=UPI00189617C0|nr:A24 family peptidase [Nocardia transvalensis]MBF6332120.1 prepilin peptidase [Nocardia transvalensis]